MIVFLNLNVNLKNNYICLFLKKYISTKSCKFVDYKNLIENVQYNNIQENYVITILKN